MERRKSNHTKRVLKDFALSNCLCDKFKNVISTTQTGLEDVTTKLEDAESELDELRGFYLVPMPDSLTALMELESRLA